MVPEARLNPEAPEFFPNQHHHHHHNKLVQPISWPCFATPTPPQHCFSQELHTLQPQYSVYLPTLPVPLLSTSFYDGTNTSQQLNTNNTPLLAPSKAEPKVVVVEDDKEGGSKGFVAQKQVFKGVKGYGIMNGCDGLRSVQGNFVWRRKDLAEEDQQKHYSDHLKRRKVFRRADHNFNAFPKKKRGFPVLPVREDGDQTTVMIKNIPSKYSCVSLTT